MKSGFVSLIGKPNVGKSTILNLLSNKKVSIVSPKAQTTRNNVISVIDNKDYQIVLEDTPGLHTAKNALGKAMNKKVYDAINDADINVLILSAADKINSEYLSSFLNKKISIVVLNKIDLEKLPVIDEKKKEINKLFPNIPLIEMSAIDNFNVDALLKEIVKLLKEGPKYYPDTSVLKDDVFFIKEIVREKILYALKEEVPHNIAIYVKDIKHKKESVLILANIIVNKDSQKGIVIGRNGAMLKKIGTNARKDLEAYFNKRIYLKLFVKVNEGWINSPKALKELGY